MPERQEILVWTDELDDSTKAAIPSVAQSVRRTVAVSSQVLAENFAAVVRPFVDALDEFERSASAWAINEIELNVVINASGGVELIGKLMGSVESAVKITLTRRGVSKEMPSEP